MRPVSAVLLSAALALLVATGAVAKPATQKLSGTLSAVDAKARTIAVKHGDHEEHFELAPSAKIMAGAKPESLDALAVGDSVAVIYTDEGKTHVAERIDVAKSKAKSPENPAETRGGSAY
jgi:hypothetical protein